MAKDYGRRRPAKQKSRMPKQLFWLLASFLCGYLAATVFDFTSLSSWVNTRILAKHQSEKLKPAVAVKEPELPKPKFEFYTLLAKDGSKAALPQQAKIVAPQPAAIATTAVAGKPNTTQASVATPQPAATNTVQVTDAKPVALASASKDSYLIQIAAFKNRQDAEHMKAELTLKGFSISVAATSNQQGAWYRVIVGPFETRAAAEKAQLNLAQNERLKGMIRRMDA